MTEAPDRLPNRAHRVQSQPGLATIAFIVASITLFDFFANGPPYTRLLMGIGLLWGASLWAFGKPRVESKRAQRVLAAFAAAAFIASLVLE